MADPTQVHNNLNRLGIFLNGASAAATGALGMPMVKVITGGGEISGEFIGYSVSPPPGTPVGTESAYSDAMLHIATSHTGGDTVHIPLDKVDAIAFRN